MRFSLLGPFEITGDDGRLFALRSPKVRQVLALLLARSGRIVPVESLITELWGDHPPRSAQTTLQTYVYHARKEFVRQCGAGAPGLLVTSAPGYLMDVADHEVDAVLFEQLIEQGRAHLRDGRPESASRSLRRALEMCRGPILSDISTGDVLAAHVVYLEELRLQATELGIEADIRLGRGREIIPELRSLVKEYQLNEWLHGQLISALGIAGRRAEALAAYQDLRSVLDRELGLEPSVEIQRIHHEVLNSSCSIDLLALAGAPPLVGSREAG
ncbi:BTAD domain-containing putative transcriptional regulator [Kitasatospora sp. NPDC089509]|uniref:AfsR/SARP family transcriptional regulator n=1 Tax=Kitasatospora sp. NPDC089509 TaxID=3364079 RepID=UPI00381AC9D4